MQKKSAYVRYTRSNGIKSIYNSQTFGVALLISHDFGTGDGTIAFKLLSKSIIINRLFQIFDA